jgi:O-acetyl-ADP-ribose deacetylase (regulator of RNase III)
MAGLNKTGNGVVGNQWLTATRIAVDSVDFYLAELRYKYL